MSGTLKFNRRYLVHGARMEPFESGTDTIAVIEEIMALWDYGIGDLLDGAFCTGRLSGRPATGEEQRRDLILEIPGRAFFEIVLSGHNGRARYGGYLVGGLPVVASDERVNGYRVLLTTLPDGQQLRHEYSIDNGYGYAPAAMRDRLPLAAARRRTRR